MSYTLGLDLGSNSIGWASVDEEQGRLIDAGVRVFPEGVDRDQQGGEQSKNEQRRIARGMRRQIARRARRKRVLRRTLVAAGLLPEVALLPRDDERRVAWERDQFRLAEPYTLRAKALTERLEPYEIGRVLLHLNQRRGFLSNRKADRGNKKEASEMLKEISGLAAEMGERTLGQFLAERTTAKPHERVRGKHTRRDMLQAEFEAIWRVQQRFHPDLLTDALAYGHTGRQVFPREPIPLHKGTDARREFGLYGIMFFQRPMYWPKSVVGQCELEPKKKRCPRADRSAQRFRLLQEVNNLRIIDSRSLTRPLTTEERTKIIAYLSKSKERTFDEIRKHLGLLESYGFNLEAGDRKKLLGMPTDALLSKGDFFGKKWHERPGDEKTHIVRVLIDDDEDKTRCLATTEWDLDDETAERLIGLDLGEGYSSYSREAIEKLLPHLEAGLMLMSRDGTPSALERAGYLRPDQRVVNERDNLPAPPDVTNPLVRQALFEVRKLINAIIREYGKPAAIHIELAREVKGTATQRASQSQTMRERERERENAAARIREHGVKVTRDGIERYLLWQEQDEACIYSGKPISIHQLLGGDVAIDHILPYSRSLDNSLMNKVVCFRDENDAKGNRTPHDWLAETNPQKYEAVLQRAARLPYDIRNRKRPKFSQQEIQLDDFISRQLTDTAYITSQVAQYVRCLGSDIVCSKGQLTAELRHHWGLNSVLRDDGLNLKNRDDHRHHAVDAIVIALTNRSRLQQLARVRGSTETLDEPLPNFRAIVEQRINAINVSHRPRRKVAGALHEETNYGATDKPHRRSDNGDRPWAAGWIEDSGEFVYRKPLESLTLAMIEDIRDPEVKRLVTERLSKFGLTPGEKGSISKEVWKEPLSLTRKPGRASSQPAVVKKVRLVKRDATIRPIRDGSANVKPGSTHHVVIFEFRDARGKTKRELIAVSMLEAIDRVKQHQSVIQRMHPTNPDAKFVMSLSLNEMVLLAHNGKEGLYRFVTAAATSQQMWFRFHISAGLSADKTGVISKKPNTLVARKVTVDELGRIRWAND